MIEYMATIDTLELALRICDAILNEPRPPNATNEQILASLPPATQEGLMRASLNAATYIAECLSKSQTKH